MRTPDFLLVSLLLAAPAHAPAQAPVTAGHIADDPVPLAEATGGLVHGTVELSYDLAALIAPLPGEVGFVRPRDSTAEAAELAFALAAAEIDAVAPPDGGTTNVAADDDPDGRDSEPSDRDQAVPSRHDGPRGRSDPVLRGAAH